MPNVTPTTAATFIPEIWANQALMELRAFMRLSQRVTHDTDVASFQVGDILHIPIPGTFVANDKTPGSPVTLQAPSDGEVTVTLNKHKEASFLVEDVARAQVNQDLMSRYVRHAIRPIAEAIEGDLFGLYAGLSQSFAATGTGTHIKGADLLTARQKLNTSKVPMDGRFVIFSPLEEPTILGDTTLAGFFNQSQPEAVREGITGRVYGFDLLMSQLVPLSATYKNLAMTSEAMILAMRGLPQSNEPNVSQLTVQDPESGLVIRQTVAYNPSYLGVQVTLDALYGVAELRDAAGVVITSASS